MRECVCLTKSSVLINVSPTEEFNVGRGLRQGDPLSPFLFLIAVEGLNQMVQLAVSLDLWKGFIVGKDKIQISHLQFADDTLLLTQGDWRSLETIKAILQNFELVSGPKVNFNKSNLIGMNMSDHWLEQVANLLNYTTLQCSLGFVFVLVENDPLCWSANCLANCPTCTSKFLIEAFVFFWILTIAIGMITSTKITLHNLLSLARISMHGLELLSRSLKVSYGGKKDHRKIHWLSWDRVCISKEEGGLRLCDLRKFNMALLGKWNWRMLTEPDSQWVRVLNSKYAKEDGSWVVEGQTCSKWWVDVQSIVDAVHGHSRWWNQHVRHVLGNGKQTRFWHDRWIGETHFCDEFSLLYGISLNKNDSVKEMYGGGSKWRWSWRRPLPKGQGNIRWHLLIRF
uniref:Ribonuclease H protein At1g65750 family n=1 Tax=Cajanus cajan TaxID=3821 RepID=A0A151R425_CAJCA|nr:Putative ribonuclease H protein At1g65750 family [Cajanus cajan]